MRRRRSISQGEQNEERSLLVQIKTVTQQQRQKLADSSSSQQSHRLVLNRKVSARLMFASAVLVAGPAYGCECGQQDTAVFSKQSVFFSWPGLGYAFHTTTTRVATLVGNDALLGSNSKTANITHPLKPTYLRKTCGKVLGC